MWRANSAPSRNSLPALKRDRTQGDFPADALDGVFQTGKDLPGTTEGVEPQWIVFRVTGVTVPQIDMTSADAKRLQTRLVSAYSDGDLVAQYLANLQTELGATINEAALTQVIGGTAN